MLLDKKKVGKVTKVGAVIIALVFILSYIPMVAGGLWNPTGDQVPSQPQTQAQATAKIASLEQAAQKNPKDANTWIQLGNAYADQGIRDKAIESYSKGLELDPKNVDARIDRANNYFYSGQVDTATAEAKKGIEINPKHANAYYNLAVFLSVQSKAEEAIKAYETYIKLEPKGEGVQRAKEQIKALEKSMESTAAVEGSGGSK